MPRVTALREQRHDRVRVELDGARWRVIPAAAVVRAGLSVGCPLDRERARTLARELRRARALEVGTRALGRRDRTTVELALLLERRGVRPDDRAEAVAALERAGYVDDERFALVRASSLAERGQGDAAIEDDLDSRGIPKDAIAAALTALEPEHERADRLVRRLGASLGTARTLARRGFSEESLEGALGGQFAAGEGEPV